MKNSKPSLYEAAAKVWKTVVNKETIPDTEQLHKQIEWYKRLLNVFHAGDYFYYVFNMYTTEFDVISDNISEILGYNSNEITVTLFMEIIHPDDRSYFLSFESKVVEFFKTLPFEKAKYYKVQYDIRLRKKDGRYIRILHQAVQVDYDEKNYYRTLSLDTDISHIKPEGIPCFSIIGFDNEPSYYNIQVTERLTKSFDLFTKREKEILKCIVEGKNTKTIADELFISINTVNNHRKNILSKAEVHTPLELVCKSIKEGWI
ncbi:LuxR C-terminal-related transcriptional regulator [Epilithonimonas zeae]|uniref:Transcriptional regulator, LuxR family n=1 Tax=Epilithonimonas zeae TaxID=1416779 RepID=A0A1N6ENV7_9FLAO|nr:LuxR C-terminal-related transcriptional regulator [Epilithonimonas zeae]SIN84695.1 transcriptional regulator, LuxR family [Epilithonimonas zeae]